MSVCVAVFTECPDRFPHKSGGLCFKSGSCTGAYSKFSDQSYDENHGNACFKPGGPFKGGSDWECPAGCTKVGVKPWCGEAEDTAAPCRVAALSGLCPDVEWCALSEQDFDDKTNEFGNCGSFCFACSERDEELGDREMVTY